jgi:tetratricopeptide (TPR) repeat protein
MRARLALGPRRASLPVMKHLALLPAAALLLSAPALADEAAARAAFAAGDWAGAEYQASQEETASSMTLAAEAALTALVLGEAQDRQATAERARALAERAVELDPANADAQFRLGMAIGYAGRYVSRVGAFMRGLPRQSRRAMDAGLALAPDDARGIALLGGWHMEVDRRGGARAFGASRDEGIALYSQAAEAAPDDALIAYLFALALVAADPDAYGQEASAQLDRALAMEPDDAVETGVLDLAEELRTRLETDPADAQAWAVRRFEE